MGGMSAWMLTWSFLGLAVLVALVAGTFWLLRASARGPVAGERPESADEVLRRRFAAGEIDEDEYFRRRAGLNE